MMDMDSEEFKSWATQFLSKTQNTYIAFRYDTSEIAERVWELDPSPDKRFLPDLERWVLQARGRIEYFFDDHVYLLPGVGKALALCYADPSLLDGAAVKQLKPAKQQIARRRQHGMLKAMHEPVASPLSGYSHVDKFLKDMHRQKLRREFRQTNTAERDAEYIGSGQVTLLHSNAQYKIYHIKSAEAHEAYASEIAMCSDDDYQIETPDGARYRYPIGALYVRDETDEMIGYMKMKQLFPGFFDIMKPEVERYLAIADEGYFRRVIAGTRRYIEEWHDLSSLDDEVAYFRRKFNIEKIKGEMKSDREASWKWKDIPDNLDRLMAFPEAEKALTGAEIREAFLYLVECQLLGTAQEFLARIVNYKSWRETITAEDIKPLFDKLSRAHRYSAKDMAMAYLFTITAQHPRWLTGGEARYLPQTLQYLSQTRKPPFRNSRKQPEVDPDWKRIKILLRRAIGFAPWREVLTPEIMDGLTVKGDNYMKNLGLPVIWERLAALRPEAAVTSRSTNQPAP